MKKLLALLFILLLFTSCEKEVKFLEKKEVMEIDNKTDTLDTFIEVINHQEKFFLKNTKEELLLGDFIFPYTRERFSDSVAIEVAVTDINEDRENEIFFKNIMGDILFLWKNEGVFFGYAFTFRNMYNINTDGSFSWNNPTHNSHGVSKICLLNGELFIIELCKVEELEDNSINYYINNNSCCEKEFNDFFTSLSKEKAVFVSFNNKHKS